jgi:polysaccharide export outer membrane protein
MPKSVSFQTVLLSMLILILFLVLPVIVSAEQVEDISETEEQQVQPVDAGAVNMSAEPVALPLVVPPQETAVQDEVIHAPLPVQEPTAQSSVPTLLQAAKPAAEIKPDDKSATVKALLEKATPSSGSVSVTNTSENSQKLTEATTSTTWQSFLALFGLYDDRISIPPIEIRNAAIQIGQDYIIGPGDLLGISVWRDDSLTKTVVVLPDGKIQFPLIGEVVAGGKSVAQLKKEFVEKLTRFVVDADISVEVKQSNSLFIYIIGKVNSPGRQMLVADTTVLQALAMAGGLNIFAEKDDVRIFRQEKDRTLVYSFRYSQVVSGNNLDDNLLLRRGDVIFVP